MAAGDGLVSMTPTSIAHSGTSASINADGGVDFTAVTELSLNGVFTSEIDNYLIVISAYTSVDERTMRFRLRASGSDASGSDYTKQQLRADASSATGARTTGATEGDLGNYDTATSGDTVHLYGPALAQPTAVRNINVDSDNGAEILDRATTHSLSTSYDGITIYPTANAITGNIHVFGYEE